MQNPYREHQCQSKRYQLRMIDLPLRRALTINSTRESITEESFNSSTVFEESSPKLEEATTFQSTEQIFERIGCFEEGYEQQKCRSPSTWWRETGRRGGQSQAKAQRAGCFVNFCQRAGPLHPLSRGPSRILLIFKCATRRFEPSNARDDVFAIRGH